MVQDAQGPEEWLLLSTCVTRMSELHQDRRFPGLARDHLENAIRAGRIALRGYRPGLTDPTPEVFDEQITARHRIDLITIRLVKGGQALRTLVFLYFAM
jgi:hypothetical protein